MMRALAVLASLLCAACAHTPTTCRCPPASRRGATCAASYRAALCSRDRYGEATSARARCAPYDGRSAGAAPAAGDRRALSPAVRAGLPGELLSAAFTRSRTSSRPRARTASRRRSSWAWAGATTWPPTRRIIAEQIERMPDDGRRLVLVGHSKGVSDIARDARHATGHRAARRRDPDGRRRAAGQSARRRPARPVRHDTFGDLPVSGLRRAARAIRSPTSSRKRAERGGPLAQRGAHAHLLARDAARPRPPVAVAARAVRAALALLRRTTTACCVRGTRS